MKTLIAPVVILVAVVALWIYFKPSTEYILKVPGKAYIEGFKSAEDCHYYFDTHFDEHKDKHVCVAK